MLLTDSRACLWCKLGKDRRRRRRWRRLRSWAVIFRCSFDLGSSFQNFRSSFLSLWRPRFRVSRWPEEPTKVKKKKRVCIWRNKYIENLFVYRPQNRGKWAAAPLSPQEIHPAINYIKRCGDTGSWAWLCWAMTRLWSPHGVLAAELELENESSGFSSSRLGELAGISRNLNGSGNWPQRSLRSFWRFFIAWNKHIRWHRLQVRHTWLREHLFTNWKQCWTQCCRFWKRQLKIESNRN